MANILHQLEREEDDANLVYLHGEIARLRLTEAERAAIAFALDRLRGTLRGNAECDHADALAGLLARHGTLGHRE